VTFEAADPDPIVVPGLPLPLRRFGEPAACTLGDRGELTLSAGPKTDWFTDPSGDGTPVLSAPALLAEPQGDFMLRAFVHAEHAATYDAGVLVLYANERAWAKLCLEYSPQRTAMVVSVVTRGVSDDCNSWTVEGDGVWLRVSRIGTAFAFHASADGDAWQLVRHFALDTTDPVSVGFEAQSPTGGGCSATFSRIALEQARLADLRSGV
jgi:uncharacterized protein